MKAKITHDTGESRFAPTCGRENPPLYHSGGHAGPPLQQIIMNENNNRHSIRLKNYDYSQSGWYFIMICTQNRENMFGEIVGANHDSPFLHHESPDFKNNSPAHIKLNKMGEIVENIGIITKTISNYIG